MVTRIEDHASRRLAQVDQLAVQAIGGAAVAGMSPQLRERVRVELNAAQHLELRVAGPAPCPDLLVIGTIDGVRRVLIIIESKIAGAWLNWGAYVNDWPCLRPTVQERIAINAIWWSGEKVLGKPDRFPQTDLYAGQLDAAMHDPRAIPCWWPADCVAPQRSRPPALVLLLPMETAAAVALAETSLVGSWSVVTAAETTTALSSAGAHQAAAVLSEAARPLHPDGRRQCVLLSDADMWRFAAARSFAPALIGPTLDVERSIAATGGFAAIDRAERHPLRFVRGGAAVTGGMTAAGPEIAFAGTNRPAALHARLLDIDPAALPLGALPHAEAGFNLAPRIVERYGDCRLHDAECSTLILSGLARIAALLADELPTRRADPASGLCLAGVTTTPTVTGSGTDTL